MTAEAYDVNARTKVLRLAKRGHYDYETVHAIVDAALICHVAYVIDGQPYMLPTLHARDGETILLHGHGTNRTLLHAGSGEPVCIGITHTDGIVLARSIFNHSINYRSVAIYGRGRLITDPEEKTNALYRFSEKLLPGRWDDVRPMSELDLKATAIIAVKIEDASAKIRSGMPKDEPEDLSWPTWAGVIPMRESFGTPIADEHTPTDLPFPGYLQEFMRHRQPG